MVVGGREIEIVWWWGDARPGGNARSCGVLAGAIKNGVDWLRRPCMRVGVGLRVGEDARSCGGWEYS